MKKIVTNDGRKGGWLKGKPHYDKNGKSLGGIKAVVTDQNNRPVELEGGEVIINKEASAKHWKELSRINQSAGNGVAIGPPSGASDEDPEEYKDGGNVIEFNPNHTPNKWILEYAKNIKEKHPEIWKLGGNIFGNEAFKNLKRVSERGYWLDSEKWMYIKWRSYVARHKKDFRIEGVVAMLKWVDKVDKGWAYMKDLIEEKISKIKEKGKGWKHKMKDGGNVDSLKLVIKNTDDKTKYQKEYKKIFDIIEKDIAYYNPYGTENEKLIGTDFYIEITPKPDQDKIDKIQKIPNVQVLESFRDIFDKGGRAYGRTPAPKKDRVFGSKVNKPGSASSKESAKSIQLAESTINSIKSIIKGTGISLATAKAVVRRGMGAYSSSHRPTISGGKPNSRVAWGFARLNAFVYKKEHGKSKSGKYIQDDDLMKNGGELEKGIKTEQEHRKTLEGIASGKYTVDEAIKMTAKDHLKEDPKYYTKLLKMEQKMGKGGTVTLNSGHIVKEGDKGTYTGRLNVKITVTSISNTRVSFIEDGGEKNSKNIENFKKQFVPDVTQTPKTSHAKLKLPPFKVGDYIISDKWLNTNGWVLITEYDKNKDILRGIDEKAMPYKYGPGVLEAFEINYFRIIPDPTKQQTLRVKTEEELKKEFGVDWRRKARFNTVGTMDFTLGKNVKELTKYDDNKINKLFNEGKTFLTDGLLKKQNGWTLYAEMLTYDPLPTVQEVKEVKEEPQEEVKIEVKPEEKIKEPKLAKPKPVENTSKRLNEWVNVNMKDSITMFEELRVTKTLADLALALSIPTKSTERDNSKIIFDVLNKTTNEPEVVKTPSSKKLTKKPDLDVEGFIKSMEGKKTTMEEAVKQLGKNIKGGFNLI